MDQRDSHIVLGAISNQGVKLEGEQREALHIAIPSNVFEIEVIESIYD